MTKKFNEKVCEFLWRPMYTCGINVSRIVRLPTSTACGPGIYKTSSVGGEEEKTYRNTKKKKKALKTLSTGCAATRIVSNFVHTI